MRTRPKAQVQGDFIAPVRRAMNRAARKARSENRRLGLPVILWKDGKVVKQPA